VDEAGKALCILTGNSGGPLQTVPRAELIAVIRALKSITGEMTLWSDCKYVVDGMHKIQYRPTLPLPKKNRTPWIDARKLIIARTSVFIIHKVLAHATHQDVRDGKLSPWERLGNHIADKYAGGAAERYAIKSKLLEELDLIDSQPADILKRLIAINLNICEKIPEGERRPHSKA